MQRAQGAPLVKGGGGGTFPLQMDKALYNGTVAYLRTKRLEGVSKEAWGASTFRMKKNGMRYNDRETKKRFKKFALLHELKGFTLCLLACCTSTPIACG